MRHFLFLSSLLALAACSEDKKADPAEPQTVRFPVTEEFQVECLNLKQHAQNAHPILGWWSEGAEVISFSFKGRTDGETSNGGSYEGPATVTELREEDNDKVASLTAGDYKVELSFNAQNQAFSQRLTEDANVWISFDVQGGFYVTVSQWKLKSAENGELWALNINQEWLWDLGKEGEENYIYPQTDLKGHLVPLLSEQNEALQKEGFSISIDALDSENACGVDAIDCLEGPGHFLPLTLKVGDKEYTHLHGSETIEKDNLHYRFNVIEASTDAGTVMNCTDVPSGNHLRFSIALED